MLREAIGFTYIEYIVLIIIYFFVCLNDNYDEINSR